MKRSEAEKEALAEEAWQRALDYELEFGCCPQCVLAVVQELLGGVSDDLIKASHGLSGGCALEGKGACGALSGGLVALSTRAGRDRDKLHAGRGMGNFQLGKELAEAFRKEFGGFTCEDLQKAFTGRTYDMWKPEEYAAFSRARGSKCAEATAWVTRWVVRRLMEMEERETHSRTKAVT